jgi:hypothetical protein
VEEIFKTVEAMTARQDGENPLTRRVPQIVGTLGMKIGRGMKGTVILKILSIME